MEGSLCSGNTDRQNEVELPHMLEILRRKVHLSEKLCTMSYFSYVVGNLKLFHSSVVDVFAQLWYNTNSVEGNLWKSPQNHGQLESRGFLLFIIFLLKPTPSSQGLLPPSCWTSLGIFWQMAWRTWHFHLYSASGTSSTLPTCVSWKAISPTHSFFNLPSDLPYPGFGLIDPPYCRSSKETHCRF